MLKTKHPINAAALSKKYKCDVNRLIHWWKRDKNDYEISSKLGIDALKLLQIRQEIMHICEMDRQRRAKKSSCPTNPVITNKPR